MRKRISNGGLLLGWSSNLGTCPNWESNGETLGSWDNSQATQPHQPGLIVILIYIFFLIIDVEHHCICLLASLGNCIGRFYFSIL